MAVRGAAAVEPTLNLNYFEIQLINLQLSPGDSPSGLGVASAGGRGGPSTMWHLQGCREREGVSVRACARACERPWGQRALCAVPKRGRPHLESVRFNAQSHGPRSAQSPCLLAGAAVQTPARRALLGSRQVPVETVAPLSDFIPIPHFKVTACRGAPAANSCPRHLSEAAFILPREGKYRNLGASARLHPSRPPGPPASQLIVHPPPPCR